MKAAVLHTLGGIPRYEDFPDPVPNGPDEILINIKAASVKNIDRGRAMGSHYDKYVKLPIVVGIDGVGYTEDGKRVYTGFGEGAIAEKTIVNRKRCIPLSDGIDDVTAAALPNPGLSAWFSLSYRAAMKPGDKVLILGATGITGKIAVQLARYFGASSVVATGRNEKQLQSLPALGADVVISLAQSEEDLKNALKAEAAKAPFDIVIDYVWGRPAELVLDMLSGHDLNAEPHRTRYVQVGNMAGANITLNAGILRSAAIELYGVGGGSIPKEVMRTVPGEILPKLVDLVVTGKLKMDIYTAPLSDVENAWQLGDVDGKRLVITMD